MHMHARAHTNRTDELQILVRICNKKNYGGDKMVEVLGVWLLFHNLLWIG